MTENRRFDATIGLIGRILENKSANQSYIGGEPTWHDVTTAPDITNSICKICNKNDNILFIGQIYAPTDSVERSLYIFACNNRKCSLQSNGWLVFRNQSDQESSIKNNKVETVSKEIKTKSVWDFIEDDSGDEDLENIKSMITKNNKSNNNNMIISPKSNINTTIISSVNSSTAYENILVCYSVNDFEDYFSLPNDIDDDDSVELDNDKDNDHINKLLQSYIQCEEDATIVQMLNTNTVSNSDIQMINVDDEETNKIDNKLSRLDQRSKTELIFQRVVNRYPKQVLRYAYEGEPLWCTIPLKSYSCIPHCIICNQTKIFEMQLMPALIPFLKNNFHKESLINSTEITNSNCNSTSDNIVLEDIVRPNQEQITRLLELLDDGIDYGVVVIYSCPNSCSNKSTTIDNNNAYMEHTIVQPPADIST